MLQKGQQLIDTSHLEGHAGAANLFHGCVDHQRKVVLVVSNLVALDVAGIVPLVVLTFELQLKAAKIRQPANVVFNVPSPASQPALDSIFAAAGHHRNAFRASGQRSAGVLGNPLGHTAEIPDVQLSPLVWLPRGKVSLGPRRNAGRSQVLDYGASVYVQKLGYAHRTTGLDVGRSDASEQIRILRQ